MQVRALQIQLSNECDGEYLIAEFYLVDRGLRHRLPGFSSLNRRLSLRRVSAGPKALLWNEMERNFDPTVPTNNYTWTTIQLQRCTKTKMLHA